MSNHLGIRRKIYQILLYLDIIKEKSCSIYSKGIHHTIEPDNRNSLEEWSKEVGFGQAYLFKGERDISSIDHN